MTACTDSYWVNCYTVQVALCYLASGNLWLSFWVKRGIQDTGGRDGKCVLYHSCNRNNLVYFWVPIKTQPLRCVTKGFFQDAVAHPQHLAVVFAMCHSAGCSPFSLCVSQTVTNELLIDLINNMASGWKMMKKNKNRETGKDGASEKRRESGPWRCWML